METTNILFIIVWVLITIEIIILLTKTFKLKQLNHLPTHEHPFDEVYFQIIEIKSVSSGIFAEYTAIVSFFKKPNATHFVCDKYKFYARIDKYNIGDKLYLNKR